MKRQSEKLCSAHSVQTDLDGDSKVDLSDLVILTQAYGSKPGAPNWNHIADIYGAL